MAKGEAERQQISVWVIADDLRRADALVSKIAKDRSAAAVGRVTRSAVFRLALSRGLEVLEKEYK